MEFFTKIRDTITIYKVVIELVMFGKGVRMKKIGKLILWIVFFPFMLTYWGHKSNKKPVFVIGCILSCIVILAALVPDSTNVVAEKQKQTVVAKDKNNIEVNKPAKDINVTVNNVNKNAKKKKDSNPEIKEPISQNKSVEDKNNEDQLGDSKEFEGYTLIQVDGGNLSGYREPNVCVDIGFGDRLYYAFTNEYGQLIKVIADEIILQDESKEPVTSKGRYYADEAKVPGTESKTLDEGHVIADSLGGVANAYNITPQDSTLNRHGNQAYMEDTIRKANGCTDFVAIITYPNSETQTPSHYSYTYTINGNVIKEEFDNVNSDKANEEIIKEQKADKVTSSNSLESTPQGGIKIIKLDKKAEVIVIKNSTNESVNLSGWKILSVLGGQDYYFSDYTLEPKSTVTVGDSEKNSVDFHWLEGRGVWNNSKSDSAELYDSKGNLIDRFED